MTIQVRGCDSDLTWQVWVCRPVQLHLGSGVRKEKIVTSKEIRDQVIRALGARKHLRERHKAEKEGILTPTSPTYTLKALPVTPFSPTQLARHSYLLL